MRIYLRRVITGLFIFGFSLAAAARPIQSLDEQKYKSLKDAAYASIRYNIDFAKTHLGAADGAIPASTGSAFDNVNGEHQRYNLYSWFRDAAEVAEPLNDSYANATDPLIKSKDRKYLQDYTLFNLRIQYVPMIGGHGEAKIHLNGEPYNDNWGRPQNDGPAHRATTIAKFAETLVTEGDLTQAHLLFGSVITKDLDYVAKVYNQKGFDFWEERFGYHFPTLMTQHEALLWGIRLARTLQIRVPSEWQAAATKIESWIPQFWQDGVVVSSIGDNGQRLNDGRSDLDTLVLMAALNHGNNDFRSYFSASHPAMLSTAERLREAFEKEIPLNRQSRGFFAGRYPGDKYFGGNIWPLCTFAFAQFYYQVGIDFTHDGSIQVMPENITFLRRILGQSDSHHFLRSGMVFRRDSKEFEVILLALLREGDTTIDNMMKLIGVKMKDGRYEIPNRLEISEQYSKHDGNAVALPNLTWNYDRLIRAIQAREKLVAILKERDQSENESSTSLQQAMAGDCARFLK